MKTKILWHYDAVKNGGATIIDCLKIEINLMFNKQIFEL